MRRARALFLVPLFLPATACIGGELPPAAPPKGVLHPNGAKPPDDPTVKGAHLVPESIDEEKNYGAEPGGGVRTIVLGLRMVSLPSGAVLTAPDRLPQASSTVVELPDRLGGGFLFQLGQTLWYAEKWLAKARPIFQSTTTISRIVAGLDRVYVRGNNGSHQAFDPRTGARLDLGPWPGTPFVGQYAAADAWRAVAIADFRGAVATFDAGATWRNLNLPIDARDVVVTGDAIAVGGPDVNRVQTWYEVRGDGQVAKLASAPVRESVSRHVAARVQLAAQHFGKHPLRAAIEDGWPLSDGTAVVARDGMLARVRLSDGTLVEAVTDAFLLRPSRCHPISLARPKDTGAFGFVCGEPRGKTVLYRFDWSQGRMIELKTFDQPRAVLSSGNGAIAVRGACAPDVSPEEAARGQQSYCLLAKDDQWREIRVRGDVGGERIIVLADGRVAVVSPPRGDLTTARVTILDKGKASTVPVIFPPITQDVARVLRLGVWMDGFEERRPGILGGWIEASGSVLGIEIAVDGHAKIGKYVREAGQPMVSGRYGLGFTGARRGYETTDGGITWKDIELPDPAMDVRKVHERACGPVGCTAAGWMRIGWGDAAAAAKPEPPPTNRTVWRSSPPLELECEPAAGRPPELPKTAHAKPEETSPAYRPHYYPYGYPYGPNQQQGVTEFQPFYSVPGPTMKPDELGIMTDVVEQADRYARYGATTLKMYAWGPKNTDWDRSGRWAARWVWPFGGWPDIQSSQIAVAPFSSLDAAKRALSQYVPGVAQVNWYVGIGDDARHVLALGKRHGTTVETDILAFETDRPPVQVRRSDDEPIGDVEAVVRAGGHWYVAAAQSTGELPSTVVSVVEGSFVREIARVPRGGYDARPVLRLARRSDGRAIGLVVEGQPAADRSTALRWVLPLDVESGQAGEPELLGSVDFAEHPLTACASPIAGWILDAPITTSTRVHVGTANHYLQSPFARLRISRDQACVEMLGGALDAYNAAAEPFVRTKPLDKTEKPSIPLGLFTQRMRYPMRCTTR